MTENEIVAAMDEAICERLDDDRSWMLDDTKPTPGRAAYEALRRLERAKPAESDLIDPARYGLDKYEAENALANYKARKADAKRKEERRHDRGI